MAMFLAFTLFISLRAVVTEPIQMASLPKTMKAVGFYKSLPIEDPDSLLDLVVELPVIQPGDILVQVKASGVNPIDYKLRSKPINGETPKILGMDGAGVVVAKGENVQLFNVGDEVLFNANFRRNGSNAEYVALEEINAGHKPKGLTFEEAAAMAIVGATAYESLFDRLELSEKDKGKTLLVINSAGGVGSVACQLAKNLGMEVIGTASRKESKEFSIQNGADVVLNHRENIEHQLEEMNKNGKIDYILVNYDPSPYWETLMKIIKPFGKICLIVDSSAPVDIKPLKAKSITLVSEMLSTRILYNTDNKIRNHEIIEEVSKLLETGKIKHTLKRVLTPINAKNLKEAHKIVENQHMIGKLVLSGF